MKKNKRSPHPYTRKAEGQNFIENIWLGITVTDGDCKLVRGVESPGTKLITRMPIFDRASTLIYYTRRLC